MIFILTVFELHNAIDPSTQFLFRDTDLQALHLEWRWLEFMISNVALLWHFWSLSVCKIYFSLFNMRTVCFLKFIYV